MNDVALFLLTFIGGYIPLFLVWVFVHESGHALAAWLAGFRISSFGVGPFYLVLTNGKYRFRFVKHTIKSYFGRVHPLIHDITTDEQYAKLKYKVAFVAIAGHVLEWSSVIAFIILGPSLIPNQTVAFTLLTLVITFTALALLMSSETAITVKMLAGHELLVAGHVYIWSLYANNSSQQSNRFIVTKLLQSADRIEQLQSSRKSTGLLPFCTVILELCLTKQIPELPASVRQAILTSNKRLSQQPNGKKINQEQLSLAYLYITYCIVSGIDTDSMKQWFFELEKRFTAVSEDAIYQHKRAGHFVRGSQEIAALNGRDHSPKFFYCEEGYEDMNRTINSRMNVSA